MPGRDWRAFAEWAAGPLDLSPCAVGRAKAAVTDTVACIMAGWDTPAARAGRALCGQTPALRGFAIATAAHALDFDDYDRPSIGHPSAVIVPTMLAMTETKPASGDAALQAFVAGLEAMDRIGESVNPEHDERGWHATATLGVFGSAVAAGRLLGLDAGQMANAISLAAGTASGLKAQFGAQAKVLNTGFAALHGIMAAELAAAGADAQCQAVDAFIDLYGPAQPRPMPRFGAPLAIEEFGLIQKPWPCCSYLCRLVEGAIALSQRHRPDDIASVRVEMPARNAAATPFAWPSTEDEARFSAPCCVAVALETGALGIADFERSALRRPEIEALAGRVTRQIRNGPQSPTDLAVDDPDVLTLVLEDGRRVERICTAHAGMPERPMTEDQALSKLNACGAGRSNLDGLKALLDDLPDVPDVGTLTNAMELAWPAA